MKEMKVARGTKRKNRRLSIDVFRGERAKALAAQKAMGSVSYNVLGKSAPMSQKSQHLHDVATVTDIRNGMHVTRRYGSSTEYPANVPCPCRPLLWRYPPTTKARAISDADRINRISVR